MVIISGMLNGSGSATMYARANRCGAQSTVSIAAVKFSSARRERFARRAASGSGYGEHANRTSSAMLPFTPGP